jgi:hypothetical protein
MWAGVPLAVRGEITVGQFAVFNIPNTADLAVDCPGLCCESLPARYGEFEEAKRNLPD